MASVMPKINIVSRNAADGRSASPTATQPAPVATKAVEDGKTPAAAAKGTTDTVCTPKKDIDPSSSAIMTDAAADKAPAAPAAAQEPKPADAPVDTAAPAVDTDLPKRTKKGGEAAKDGKTPVDASAETRDTAPDAADAADAADATKDEAKDETKDEAKDEAAEAAAAAEPAEPAETTEAAETESAPAPKPSASRRKSSGPKLNRKASKARITHLDAKPGEHYFVKLKGYPAWPVIICDEEMLPDTLLKSRPVSAARPDGTYREDYADGGKRATDRTFPVMYLFTNEFGWVPNQDMHDLDPSKVLEAVNDKMRKDLQQAHTLAAESNPLSYYKEMLQQFKEDQERAEEAKRQAQAAPKKSKKAAGKDADIDMLDVPVDDDEEEAAPKKAAKKRKADDDARTPQRSDSVKKPKIKITSSNAAANGTAASKGAKSKSKKADASAAPAQAPHEPELSPEEKLRRKTKEVYFLRHKIQKSLLTRDQEPKAEEMKLISDYLTKLEGFSNLEVSIIRETKINKVLKAILKIETIPREDEFKFKPRSHTLLDKWSKLLAESDAATAAPAETNGATTNGHEKKDGKANGVHEETKADEEPPKEPKEEPAAVEASA